jgi:hypothetical protein
MKRLKVPLITTITVMLLVFAVGGLVAAQTADESFVRGLLSNPNPNAGDTITVSIFYHNNSTETVIIDYAGVHFDWMPTDSLYGFNTSSSNIQVPSGRDYFFQQPINIKVPTNANGNHTYYAGIDGHTSSSAPVSLSSDPVEFLVNGNGSTAAPTGTNSGTDNQEGGVPDTVFYIAIIAVVAVVALLLVVVLMRRKRKLETKSTERHTNQPAPDQPQQKPSSGQDFSI